MGRTEQRTLARTVARQIGTRLPNDQAVDIAIMWLQNNEGNGIEKSSCDAVARFLEGQKMNRLLRSEAKKGGIPVGALRRKLQERARR